MKTQVLESRFTTFPLIVCVVSLTVISVLHPMSAIAQVTNQVKTLDDIVQTYDNLENDLLHRFDVQIANRDPELTKTVKALAHIRSRRAIPLFLSNIEVVPGPRGEKVGDFYPVEIVGATTYRNVYVMLDALINVGGIPIKQCIAEVEKAKDGSIRETLLVNLGERTHGEAFTETVRNLASAAGAKGKWERILGLLLHD